MKKAPSGAFFLRADSSPTIGNHDDALLCHRMSSLTICIVVITDEAAIRDLYPLIDDGPLDLGIASHPHPFEQDGVFDQAIAVDTTLGTQNRATNRPATDDTTTADVGVQTLSPAI